MGLSLGVEPAVLNTIKANHPGDVEGACRDLLCRWLSQGTGTGEQPREWLPILKAIKETMGECTAEEIERDIETDSPLYQELYLYGFLLYRNNIN